MKRAALTCLLLAVWSLVGKAQEADAMTMPLAVAGDPAIGRAIFSDRESGHCVLCHQVDGLEVPFQGNLGPALSDVGARLTEAQIRLRIVDNTKVNPGTVMPSYYRTSDLHQVGRAYQGETVLSAAEVEHLVAWLSQLTGRKE
jgi:sulfur-oxidizing protein SoxX